MTLKVTIVWRDENKEPLTTNAEACYPDQGFLCLEVTEDYLPAGCEQKTLMFPADTIQSVEASEFPEPSEKHGYREESTFREQPLKGTWHRGMGRRGSNDGR